MALKLLSDEVGTRSHDIGKLFSRFSELAPTEAHKVEMAVREYAASIEWMSREHPEFSSASSFLGHVGDEYVNCRYWPLEDSTMKFTWPSLLVEIATSLGAVLLDQQPPTVQDRIMFHLGDAVTYPTRC